MPIPEGILAIYCPECGRKVKETHSRELIKETHRKLVCRYCNFRCLYTVKYGVNLGGEATYDEIVLSSFESNKNEQFKAAWLVNKTTNIADGLICIVDGNQISTDRKSSMNEGEPVYHCVKCGARYDIRRWN